MPEPARDAALILLTIASLGGAVLMLVTLAKVLLAWSTSWRPDKDADPRDIDALRQLAAAAMAAVASRASVAAPAVHVVAVLGVPLANSGGTSDWRWRPGRHAVPRRLPAHRGVRDRCADRTESRRGAPPGRPRAHVIRRERSSAAGRYVWLAAYLVLMAAGAGLSVTALATSPQLGGLALMSTLATAVAFLGLQVAFDRREEIAADLFAAELTHDLDAAAELMRFLDEHVTRPLPDGCLARAVARLERRWFATHPPAPGATRRDALSPGQ